METKRFSISRKSALAILIGFLVSLCVLLCAALFLSSSLSSATEEAARLRTQKDPAALSAQIDALQAENAELQKQAAAVLASTDDKILEDIRAFLNDFYTRDYMLYDSEAFYDLLYANTKPRCTDRAYAYFCPEQDFSYIREPLGTGVDGAEPVYMDNLHVLMRIEDLSVSWRKTSVDTLICTAIYTRYSGAENSTAINTGHPMLLNMSMQYNPERNVWCADTVYSDTLLSDTNPNDLK